MVAGLSVGRERMKARTALSPLFVGQINPFFLLGKAERAFREQSLDSKVAKGND